MTIRIEEVDAWTILDSRGRPTIRVEVRCSDGTSARGDAPAGASRGSREAAELRDGAHEWHGFGVKAAVCAATTELAAAIYGKDVCAQEEVDRAMRDADGTADLSRLGGNAIIAISAAVARCGAIARGLPLYRHLARRSMDFPPVPLMNVINGGAHALNGLRIQECMIVPHGPATVADRVRCGAEIYATLRDQLRQAGGATTVGDEGGFVLGFTSLDETLKHLTKAIARSDYRPGIDVSIAIDAAANGFFRDGIYEPEPGISLTSTELVDWWSGLVARHPIVMLEDACAEDDNAGWRLLTDRLGSLVRIVGDDNFVTNAATIASAAHSGIANTALIKPNQAGTLSDALAAVRSAREARYQIVVSHRSGETADTLVADLAWSCAAEYLKAGAPARAERTEKYNRLIEIERTAKGAREPASR